MFGTPQPWVVNLADRDAPPMSIGPLYTAKMRGRNRSVPFDKQISGALARMG